MRRGIVLSMGMLASAGCLNGPSPAGAKHESLGVATTPPPVVSTAVQPASPEPSHSSPEKDAPRGSNCLVESIDHDARSRLEALNALCADIAAGFVVEMDSSSGLRLTAACEHLSKGRLHLAAAAFLEVAHDADAEQRGLAAELGIASIDSVGTRADPIRNDCWDLMATEVSSLLGELCDPEPRADDERGCAFLRVVDVNLTKCSECVTATASGRYYFLSSLHMAAELYLKVGNRHCASAHSSRRVREREICGDMLYRAYEAFEAAGEPARAAEVRRRLLDPKGGLSTMEGASRIRQNGARPRDVESRDTWMRH